MLVRARIADENVTHAAMMIPCRKEFNPNCETDLTSANLNLRLARSRSGAVLTKNSGSVLVCKDQFRHANCSINWVCCKGEDL